MGKITTSATQLVSQEASNYDEVFMQQSLLFDDSLKVLMILYLLFSWGYWFPFLYSFLIQEALFSILILTIILMPLWL